VSKASIMKIPIVGWAMGFAKHVTVQREDRRSQVQAIRDCDAKLKNGVSIFLFPEGTRSKTGELLEFKRGAFSIARRAGVGILPITVLGTGRVMPPGREFLLFPSRRGVRIVVHPMVSAEQVQAMPDEQNIAQIQGTIASALPSSLRTSASALAEG